MNREELGGFLRSRRARLRPVEVGLAPGLRRQTPGLRREEVALLAGISVDYYIRLEQGRGVHPSEQVLGSLGRVLRLNADELDYLLRLAGPVRGAEPGEVPEHVVRLLERLDEVPAMVINARYDVLAWNRMLVALIGEIKGEPPNTLRWLFGEPLDGNRRQLARQCVADLRASGRYPADPEVKALVEELSRTSEEFAELWAAREISVQRTMVKRAVHPVVGELELYCDLLPVPGSDQRVVMYTAAPGTASAERLRRLRDS